MDIVGFHKEVAGKTYLWTWGVFTYFWKNSQKFLIVDIYDVPYELHNRYAEWLVEDSWQEIIDFDDHCNITYIYMI